MPLERNSSVSSGNVSDEGTRSDDLSNKTPNSQNSESDSGKEEEIVSAFKNYRPTVRVSNPTKIITVPTPEKATNSKFSNYRPTTRENPSNNSIETFKIKPGFEFKAIDTLSSDSISSTGSLNSPSQSPTSFLDSNIQNTISEIENSIKVPKVIGANSPTQHKSAMKSSKKSTKSTRKTANFRIESNSTYEYPSEQQLILDEAERIAQKKREVEELIQRCEAQLAMSNKRAVGGNDIFLKNRQDTLLL